MEKANHSLRIVLPGVMILVAVVAYLPALSGDFILDDRPLIKNNPYVKRLHSVVSYLSQEDGIDERHGQGDHPGYYRPLLNFSYWMDHELWGMRAAGFRVSNLFLHLLTCVFLFLVVRRLLKSTQAAFWAATIFALHPVNTEAVSWVSSRNNLLVTLFSLISLYLHILAWEKRRSALTFLSLLCFSAAILSKEYAAVMIPILILWKRFLHPEKGERSEEVMAYLPYVVILSAYLLLRTCVTGLYPSTVDTEPLWKRLFFTPYIVLVNTGLLLFPINLHSFVVPYPPNTLSWQGLSGLVFGGGLGFLYWQAKRNPVFRFSLLSFLLGLLPVLHIVPLPAASLVSMRWLYFPMTFFLMGLSSWFLGALNARRFLTTCALSLTVVYLGFLTHVLNRTLWHDEEKFFNLEVRHFGNAYYASGLAERLLDQGEYGDAERYFRTAIQEGHATAKDMINFGALLTDTGRPREAMRLLERAQKSTMGFRERAELHNNLGTASFRLENPADALRHFRKAVAFDPKEAHFWCNLGGAYGVVGDYAHSVRAFRRGLEMDPGSARLRKGLALTLLKMQDYEKTASTLDGIPEEGTWRFQGPVETPQENAVSPPAKDGCL
ncbi:MAG: tetratricopeptide repeat protein [Deltaproteobacteria bacterium]|nr:tetratricopeptide repeat protein [Deltaproteobacteria bacterium]